MSHNVNWPVGPAETLAAEENHVYYYYYYYYEGFRSFWVGFAFGSPLKDLKMSIFHRVLDVSDKNQEHPQWMDC